MAARDDLQFIDLADFTPGISTRYWSVTADQPSPDGLARAENTYGCIALPEGGLAPLPRGVLDRLGTAWENGSLSIVTNTSHWPTDPGDPPVYNNRIVLLDAHIVSPVTFIPPLEYPVSDDRPPVDVFLVRQWWVRRADDGEAEPVWYLTNHEEYLGAPYHRDGPANRWVNGYDDWGSSGREIHPSRWTYGGGSITEGRTVPQDGDALYPGYPMIVATAGGIVSVGGINTADPEGMDSSVFLTYPDYHLDDGLGGADVRDRSYSRPGEYFPVAMGGMVLGHQGRIVALSRSSGFKYARRFTYHGESSGFRAASEIIQYFNANDFYTGYPQLLVVGEEASSGYGTWYSVNSNTLLLVKNVGGAVTITGDIHQPTVTRLPGVPAVGGKANRGAMTEQGFVYGSTSGIWLWNGGESATQLAPQLDPIAWLPDDPTTELRELDQYVGSFGYSHPYLYAPNNWVCDMRNGGWWKYEPTADQDEDNGLTFAFNEVDCNGNLWAFVPSYQVPGVYGRMYDRTNPRAYYQWQSQPLARSRNRYLKYRSMTLVASGRGRVEVSITGLDGESQTVSFDLESDETDMKLEPLGLTTTDVEVTIKAEAAVDTDPAPIVHRVSLGYMEAASLGPIGTTR